MLTSSRDGLWLDLLPDLPRDWTIRTRMKNAATPLATAPRPQRVLGLIPARFASTRFPGKPLAQIAGRSLIQRVIDRCRLSKVLSEVIVATDDQRIFDAVGRYC